MIEIVKITNPDCNGCMGASFGDCQTCETKTQQIVMCKDCEFNRVAIMQREKTLCSKLHAWVDPCDFCSWGERREE